MKKHLYCGVKEGERTDLASIHSAKDGPTEARSIGRAQAANGWHLWMHFTLCIARGGRLCRRAQSAPESLVIERMLFGVAIQLPLALPLT